MQNIPHLQNLHYKDPELRNVKSFTRSKSSKAKFTPRKARKSRQIQHLEGMKLTQKATSGEQKLNILSYNPGLKTEFHISCSHLPKTILDFAKLCILPDFLPQSYNFLHGYIRHIRDTSQLWWQQLGKVRGNGAENGAWSTTKYLVLGQLQISGVTLCNEHCDWSLTVDAKENNRIAYQFSQAQTTMEAHVAVEVSALSANTCKSETHPTSLRCWL